MVCANRGPAFWLAATVALLGCASPPLTVPDAGTPDAGQPSCPECDPHAGCSWTDQMVTCTCRDGWTGDGHQCVDVDECAPGAAPCDGQHGSCTNVEGGYVCSCAPGWELALDQATCVDTVVATGVAVGDYHSCLLKTDGTIVCWGSNVDGASTPPAGAFVQLAAGSWQSCAVRTDGTLACWGYGYDSPARYAPPDGTFQQVSLGRYVGEGRHACALRTDGKVVCWEDNDFGEGRPPSGTFKQISAGHAHTCGVRTNGAIACWGRNDDGQSNSPSGTFLQVSSGDFHNCALRTNGTVACWGGSLSGDTSPPSGTFKQVSAGDYFSCGVRTDGTIACWGQGFVGQPPPSGTFVDVSVGPWEACARRADGTVLCWNSDGESTPPSGPAVPDPIDVCPGFPVGTACQCGGFPIPNPVGTGLPHPASYTDNGDGTVTDNVTGLLWEKSPSPTPDQCRGLDGTCSAVQAARYCASKGTDWRLPTRLELVSLVDVTISDPGPAINPVFPRFSTNTDFWTSTPYDGSASDLVWFVRFYNGSTDAFPSYSVGQVRCVKATPNCYAPRYQIQDGNLVYDQATGLTWQQAVYDGNWRDANATCAGMGDGWRLPSLVELQSILDDARLEPAIDEDFFPNTPANSFWTSSPSPASPLYAWTVYFADGGSFFDDASNVYHVRCVR